MKHLTILLICIGATFITYGQALTEKKFYDSTYQITDSAHASYYEIIRYADTTKKAGTSTFFSIDGHLKTEISYSNIARTERNGFEIHYHNNGQLKSRCKYTYGKLDGEVSTYYATGQIKRKDTYKNDTLISGQYFTQSGKDTTWFPFLTYAQYEGGSQAILKFINSKITYPKRAKEIGFEGKVMIQFWIDKKGEVIIEKIVSNTERLLNDEALRVFKLLPPHWTPTLLDGEPVKSKYILPIAFRLPG